MPDIDEFDEYIDSLERLIFSSLSFHPDFHDLEDAFERLWQWHDVDRFSEFPGSAGLDSTFRTSAEFEVSPVHRANVSMSMGCKNTIGPWAYRHRWLLIGGALGLGLIAGYTAARSRRAFRCRRRGRFDLPTLNAEMRPAIGEQQVFPSQSCVIFVLVPTQHVFCQPCFGENTNGLDTFVMVAWMGHILARLGGACLASHLFI